MPGYTPAEPVTMVATAVVMVIEGAAEPEPLLHLKRHSTRSYSRSNHWCLETTTINVEHIFRMQDEHHQRTGGTPMRNSTPQWMLNSNAVDVEQQWV